MSNIKQLSDRAVLQVSGSDARNFLQGLISNDINKASQEKAIFACLLSPQGKFLYDFFIIEYQDGYLIEMEKLFLPELAKKLQMYKLRSQVEIKPRDDLFVGYTKENSPDNSIIYDDPRLNELGKRVISFTKIPEIDNGEYDSARIKLGIPESSKDLTQNRSLIMEWGYDILNGIDFNKGCYVGQEVTARSKHRATLHKYVYQVSSNSLLPAKDTPIIAEGKEVGIMASSAGNIGLALLNIETANRLSLSSNEIKITAKLPVWK